MFRSGDEWTKYPGALKDISVGGNEIWGVNKKHQIYRRIGRGKWKRIGGALIQVSVSQGNHVWGVNKYHQIYRYKQKSKKWVRVAGGMYFEKIFY